MIILFLILQFSLVSSHQSCVTSSVQWEGSAEQCTKPPAEHLSSNELEELEKKQSSEEGKIKLYQANQNSQV